MKRVLIIDDERDIVELISYNLEKEGFAVDAAYDGEEALAKIRNESYDLVLLDLMLPGIQGVELCRILRNNSTTARLPIIMITARSEEVDKVIGLEMGADDYVAKPFSPRELVARAKAVLRRTGTAAEPAEGSSPEAFKAGQTVVRIRDMVIDTERYAVSIGDQPVRLSATEFKLLLYLAERPGRIFSREHLLDAVWGNDVFVEPRTVDVHIRRLRAKIEADAEEPKFIKTMRGVGYYMEV